MDKQRKLIFTNGFLAIKGDYCHNLGQPREVILLVKAFVMIIKNQTKQPEKNQAIFYKFDTLAE